MVLLTIHEEARRLEASLRYQAAGRTGARRGGSDVNTIAALDSIVRLVHGVEPDGVSAARRIVARWVRSIREIPDIGLDERWVPIPASYGSLPPACPYCRTYSLRMAPLAKIIRCVNPACRDREERPPRGRLTSNRLNGDSQVEWSDGRVTYRRDWA